MASGIGGRVAREVMKARFLAAKVTDEDLAGIIEYTRKVLAANPRSVGAKVRLKEYESAACRRRAKEEA